MCRLHIKRRLFSIKLLLSGLVLLVGGCQIQPQVEVPQVPVNQEHAVVDETDHGCSYFYFLWGRHAELLLHFEEALEAYEKALICDPEAKYISAKIPVLLLRMKRGREAGVWLENYLETHPEEVGMRMLLAKVLITQEQYDQAIEQYRIVSRHNPDDPIASLLLSELYLTRNMINEARATLERVLAQHPNSYPGLVLLARVYHLQEDFKRAEQTYHLALKQNWSGELQMDLCELYLQTEMYQKAADAYLGILEEEEDNEKARVGLVHVYLLLKKEKQALAELNKLKLVSEQPDRVDITIARLYARQQQYDKATSILLALLEKEHFSQARYLLAIVYFQTEKYEKALAQLAFIDKQAEEYIDALFLRTRILRNQERYDEAVALLELSVDDSEIRNADMFIMLGLFYQLQGKADLGDSTFNRGMNLYPEDDNLLYEYGLFLENSGERNKAVEVMQRVIQMQPNNAAALNYVGYTWADAKIQLDKALEYIKRAVALKPENGYIRDSLGWVYYRLGNFEQAIIELEEAVRLSPDDPAILDHLGDAYMEAGEVEKALGSYQKSLKLHTNEKERKAVEEKLQILKEQEDR